MKQWICTAVLLLAASAGWAAKAHQHGVATLSVAVDGSMVELEFESPLENLTGFEHAPRNDGERRALQSMKDRFAQPQSLFVPAPAAGCRPAPVQLELPEAGAGHADLHAVVSFECTTPAALRSVEVRLFEAFPRLQRVKGQLAAPGRQSGFELNRQKSRIDW